MNGTVATIGRWLLGGLLVWAGLAKLGEPRLFFLTLLEYRLAGPDLLWRFVAVTLPWLELLCGAMLWADAWRDAVRPLVVALGAAFVLATAQAWVRGLEISCGCFGARESGVWATPAVALARAMAVLALAVWLWRRAPPAELRANAQGPAARPDYEDRLP